MYRTTNNLTYNVSDGTPRQPQPISALRPTGKVLALKRKLSRHKQLPPIGSDQQNAHAVLRKLKPSAKPPVASIWDTLTTVERQLVNQRLTEPAECLFHVCFQRANAEEVFMGPSMEAEAKLLTQPSPAARSYAIEIGATKGLTVEQERMLFLRFNYCRYRLMKLLRRFRGRRLTLAATQELLKWEKAAVATRDQIVRANLPLVLAMAKRSRPMETDLSDFISEGNLALLRSVDKFDVLRGFKFSTYACRSILTGLARSSAQAGRYADLFPAEYDPLLEKSDFLETKREALQGDCVDELKTILLDNLANLSKVEQRVLRARFALGRRPEPDEPHQGRTLKEVAETIGVTRERVRQIQNKALDKLRKALEERALKN